MPKISENSHHGTRNTKGSLSNFFNLYDHISIQSSFEDFSCYDGLRQSEADSASTNILVLHNMASSNSNLIKTR